MGRAIHRQQKIVKAPAGIVDRAAALESAVPLAVTIVAVSLVDGGYGGVAMGLGALATWLAVVVVAVFGRRERIYPTGFLTAVAALTLLAALSAFSLGWSPDPGSGFTDVVRVSAYLGFFILVGLLIRPGSGRAALVGIGAGLVTVAVIAIASRLLGLGGGDVALVASFPSSSGRLSYPLGYWNALGAMTAMAVPILVWLSSVLRSRGTSALVSACFVPVLLATYMTSSRGALVAAALGAFVAVAANPDRGRSFVALVVGAVAALPSILAATLASGILDAPWSGFGRSELVVCGAAVIGAGLAAAFGPALIDRSATIRVDGLRMRHVVATAAAVLAILILLVGPGELAGDFAAKQGREATGSAGSTLSVTGSGRAQFWGAALDAFSAEPAKGIGAGGYETWWNRKGSLETPALNAHSEPLELLAELGPVGLLAFAAFFAIIASAGIRRSRSRRGGGPGAALGLLATAMVGFLIDWTWDLPAVVLPVLAAAAILTTRAFDEPAGAGGGEVRSGAVRDRLRRVPAPALALAAVILAIPSIWAGGALAVFTDRLDASDEALAAGRFDDAAEAARAAAAVESWSSAPWLRLAAIEGATGNVDAARRAAAAAVDRSPEDFRPWLLAAGIEGGLGNNQAAAAYAIRAVDLAPLVFPRASLDLAVDPVRTP
jgi:O-Antigen ligase